MAATDPPRAGSQDPATAPDHPSAAAVTDRPHFPCLEGIRAVAASMVVVHHAASLVGNERAGPLVEPAAVLDMGVAVFFVLSGFLIYRPFVTAHVAGQPPLPTRSFLWRRFLRLVPAYWAALTILWVTGVVSLGAHWWRFYLFLQVYDAYTALGGIVPAWSLNTEVVFYLVVPLWSLLLRAVAHRRPVPIRFEAIGAVVLVAAGYLSRVLFSASDRVWAHVPGSRPVLMREVSFAWFPNNVDLFGTGMALAVLSVAAASDPGLRARLDRLAQPALAWWGAALVLIWWFAYRVGPPHENGGYQGGYWQERQLILTLIALCLLVPAVFGDQGRSVVRKVLRSGPVFYLGLISYGIYLWNQPLLERIPGWLDRAPGEIPVLVALAGGFALAIGAAALSWHLLEAPVQRRWRRLV